MNNFINKINKYLIERYPTIWNTRLVWMLLIGLGLHLMFFVIGYLMYTNPYYLQVGRVEDDYFETGMFFINLIISALLLVGWLVYMFKNNGFKSLYPVKNIHFYGQFLSYFVIIFTSVSFYFSYTYGCQTYIKLKYPDSDFKADIENINLGYPFLLIDHRDYTLDNRRYPLEFNQLFCETEPSDINYSKPHFVNRDKIFQYNKINSLVSTQTNEYNEFIIPNSISANNQKLIYQKNYSDSAVFYFKGDVVDVSDKLKSSDLSIYNFSKVFFKLNVDNSNLHSYDNYTTYIDYDEERIFNLDSNSDEVVLNKKVNEILDRKNETEIKQILSKFITVADKYKIKNNLDVDGWYNLAYTPNDFVVKKFITTNSALNYDSTFDNIVYTSNYDLSNDVSDDLNKKTNYNYYRNNISEKYFLADRLQRTLINIQTFKNHDFYFNVCMFLLIFSFGLSTVIFAFRVTGLRAIIFSAVTVGILGLLIGLLTLLYGVTLQNDVEKFTLFLILFIGTLILLVPILKINFVSKLVSSVFINISLNGFILYVFLILAIISKFQRDACYKKRITFEENFVKCEDILEYLGYNCITVILISGFIFVFLYTRIIKKWRALSE